VDRTQENRDVVSRCLPLLALAFLGVAACAPLPVHTSLPVEVRPSPNFGERRPNYVVLHHTSNSDAARAVATLTRPASQVSAHYLVVRDGRIVYMVDERLRAWHAGESYWGGNRDINSASIGIEIDNDGREPYTEQQITALLALLADLKTRWSIPAANFLGHGDVAPGRKVDPGANFPWKRLAERGFGLWCDPPYEPAAPGADDALLLAALGYDVANLPAAIGAFRRRYFAVESTAPLTEAERGMAQCLRRKDEG
jgi:N-acetylmuramoyl-L-alanine amidase